MTIIGITLDYQEKGSFSGYEHYALRKQYFDAIVQAGGTPVGIPFEATLVEQYLDQVDGVLVPGGEFAMPEDWYVGSGTVKPYTVSPRTLFDTVIVEAVLERDVPMLGICAGMQYLAGVCGCKMDVIGVDGALINHWDGNPVSEVCHDITVQGDILSPGVYSVNSHHQEIVAQVSDGVEVIATATDDVIEAVAVRGKQFAVGVQWHPEFLLSDLDYQVFDAFIAAARD